MGQGKAPIKSGIPHTAVRLLTSVTAVSSCRIGLNLICHSVLAHIMLEDSLRCRRPADVSKAHEKDFVFIIDIRIVRSVHVFIV